MKFSYGIACGEVERGEVWYIAVTIFTIVSATRVGTAYEKEGGRSQFEKQRQRGGVLANND